MSHDVNFIAKLEHLSGLKNASRPSASTFLITWTDEFGYLIDYWPDDNPPTIEEIEAVELPPEPALPNWSAFRLALAGSSAYRRIVGHSNETLSLLPLLTNLAFLIDTDPPKAIEFAYVWNQVSAIAEPTSEEIATLNSIASANNVPLVLNELGLMG
jgi:hypothetical protein